MELLNDSSNEEQTNETENMETVEVTEPVEETLVEITETEQTLEEFREESGKRKQRILVGTAVLGVLVVIAIFVGLLFPGVFQSKGEVLASVGDDKIYVEDFQERVRYYRWQFLNQYVQVQQMMQYFGDYDGQQQYQLDQIGALLSNHAMFGEIVLNSMIDEAILVSKADEMGIVVSDSEVQEVIMNAFGYVPGAEVEESLDDESSEGALYADPEAEPTPYTEEMFNENFENYMNDMALADVSEDEFREVQWVSLIHNKLYDEITKDYVAGTEEQVWARHILVEDIDTALSVIEQITSGERTFEDLAMEVSIDTGSGQYGGDLGWFGRNMMIPEFEEAAFSLEVGEISEPIETTYGFHVIEVLGHEDQLISAEQQQSEIQALFTSWLETQNAVLESSIVIDQELLAESTPTDPNLDVLMDETSPIYKALLGVTDEVIEE